MSDDTNEQLIQTCTEAVRYSETRLLIRSQSTIGTTLDSIRNTKIKNPLHDKACFWNTRLDAQSDRPGKTVKDMDIWLTGHPADPWALTLRSGLARQDRHDEEAQGWFRHTREHMPSNNQEWAGNEIVQPRMFSGNWKEVGQYMAAGADKPNFNGFRRQHTESRVPQLVANAQAMKTTPPADGTE